MKYEILNFVWFHCIILAIIIHFFLLLGLVFVKFERDKVLLL